MQLSSNMLPEVPGFTYCVHHDPDDYADEVEEYQNVVNRRCARILPEIMSVCARPQIGLIRDRALEICIAMQALSLSALEMVCILEEACGMVARSVPFRYKWELVCMVKHFHNTK
jgi:hypothetical protein